MHCAPKNRQRILSDLIEEEWILRRGWTLEVKNVTCCFAVEFDKSCKSKPYQVRVRRDGKRVSLAAWAASPPPKRRRCASREQRRKGRRRRRSGLHSLMLDSSALLYGAFHPLPTQRE